MRPEMSRTGAAASRRLAKKSPMQLLVDIIDGDPTADHRRLFRTWWDRIQSDDQFMEAVALHAFTNMFAALERDKNKSAPVKPKEAIEAERKAVAALVSQVRNVVLLDLKLPNGKKLRNSTFAECSAAGGWFKMVATKGKPSQVVGAVLTEDELRGIR